jgi:hypothetical protein
MSYTDLAKYCMNVKADLDEPSYDEAYEVAIEFLVAAGNDAETLDTLGTVVSDDVQTLLTLAFARCPNLINLLKELTVP